MKKSTCCNDYITTITVKYPDQVKAHWICVGCCKKVLNNFTKESIEKAVQKLNEMAMGTYQRPTINKY
jgi:hypothetical protein